MFTKFTQLCQSNSPRLAIASQYKLMSHYELTQDVRALVEQWLVLPMTKILISELEDAQSTFNQKTFIDQCHALASHSAGPL